MWSRDRSRPATPPRRRSGARNAIIGPDGERAGPKRPADLSRQQQGQDMSSVGFIGLGVMGREMAIHLVRAGHEVRAHEARPEAVEDLAGQGAVAARSVAAVAEGADLVITMLPDTPHVEEVVLGPEGLLRNPPIGRLLVDMSTISPTATRRMAKELANAGIAMLDAPVSGGPAGAKAAKLSIMV